MTSSSLERLLLLDGKLWVDIPVKLPQLSPVFRNIHEYREDFAALLVEEARESVKSGFEQSAASGCRMKVTVTKISLGAEVTCTISKGNVDELDRILRPNVVILIAPEATGYAPRGPPAGPHALGTVLHTSLSATKQTVTVKLVSKDTSFLVPRGGTSLKHDINDHNVLGTYWLLPSTKLSTFLQEFGALWSLENLDTRMLQSILNPGKHKNNHVYSDKLPCVPQIGGLDECFNRDQTQAIRQAMLRDVSQSTNFPFTLIQGPPGTGKTHTIWGLLNALHLVKFDDYYRSIIHAIAGDTDTTQQRPHILVCAPSNGAVMNILRRVSHAGFIQRDGAKYHPSIIHVGTKNVDSEDRQLFEFSAESKARTLLGMSKEDWLLWLSRQCHTVRALEENLQTRLNFLKPAESTRFNQAELEMITREILSMYENRDRAVADLSRLEHLRPYYDQALRNECNIDVLRSALETSFVDEAEIVFTTLASSGKRCLTNVSHGFHTLVVDEAAQATELSLLVPLFHGVKHCVLVGDPQQLPSTVLSKAAVQSHYDKSFFERLVDNGISPILLSIQYRMHPSIRQFPSTFFYAGKLVDASVCTRTTSILQHETMCFSHIVPFGPYLVFDTSGGVEQRDYHGSVKNEYEAMLCVRLILAVESSIAQAGPKLTLTVISPYSYQCERLRQLTRQLGTLQKVQVHISTIDGFQGRESDAVILSCVRNASTGVGFMNDARRLNVALTRAKTFLWVLCSANTSSNPLWASLINDALHRDVVVPKFTVEEFLHASAP